MSDHQISNRSGLRPIDLIVVIALIVILFALLLPGLQKVRGENDMVLLCKSNLMQIAIATHTYQGPFRHYPPGTIAGSAKDPNERFSCLTELLPLLERYDLYKSLNLKQSWKAPDNKDAVSTPIKTFLCPSDPRGNKPSPNHTNFVGIAGAGADAASLPLRDARCGVFGYDRTVRVDDIKDGTANTLLFLETRRDAGPWAAGGPATVRGIDTEDEPPIGQNCAFGLHVGEKGWLVRRRKTSAMAAMADGSVRQVGDGTSAEVLAALATIAGADNEGLRIDW
jgi:type II secretory pathway pseudopilin PulG